MFGRAFTETLEFWSESPRRKPLVVRGARQVGKTFAVQIFGRAFEPFIELNLERDADKAIFERGLSLEDLWQAILLAKNVRVRPGGRPLLFIDEIQNSPAAMASLRHFYEDMPRLHVVAAGSLSRTMLDAAAVSFPVGRIEYRFLRPLSFREFLAATGEEQAARTLGTVPFPDYAFDRLLALFHRYTLVGGMPEVVERYAAGTPVAGLRTVYESLVTGYLDDVAKYARNETQRAVLRHCIETAPFEAGRRVSLAGFGRSNYRSREVGEALRALERAMLLTLLRPTTSTALPIEPDLRKKPRLQLLDAGLVNYVASLQSQYFEQPNLHGVYRGRLAEQIVAQEILCRDDGQRGRLHFWVREKSQSQAEVDFVLQHDGRLVPVEVKAGKAGTLRSLHLFMDASQAPLAVRLYAGPRRLDCVAVQGHRPYPLLSLPYFLAGAIPEHVTWAREHAGDDR